MREKKGIRGKKCKKKERDRKREWERKRVEEVFRDPEKGFILFFCLFVGCCFSNLFLINHETFSKSENFYNQMTNVDS